MKLTKKSEARLGSVSLACFRDSDCGEGAMNDFLPALSLRHTLLSERLEQPRFQGSFLLGPRREGEDSCNKVAPGTGYDFFMGP